MFVKIFGRVKATVLRALKQGWSRERISWSVAWGITWGVFPIYGVTTLALGGIGLVWKLNHPVMQSLNYLLGPVKLLLIIPFIRLGEALFRPEHAFTLGIPEFTLRFKDAPSQTLSEFAATFLHAIAGWMVVVPILLTAAFLLTRMILKGGEAARAALVEARS